MDVVSKEKRSKMMSNIRGKNTKPEILMRKYLFSLGYRFRIHRKDLPGNPDIVLPKYKTVIFIHGCFWHQHPNCKDAVMPKSNIEFWEKKLKRNIERDNLIFIQLQEAGWNVQIIWECEVKHIIKQGVNPIVTNACLGKGLNHEFQ